VVCLGLEGHLCAYLRVPVAVDSRAGGGEQFAETAAFGALQRKPNTSHVPRPLSMMTDGRDFPTAISA
jgi:hypothetical protein